MGNILDYIKWRGDLSFDKSEFNEVDNLVLSQISYVNFDKIVYGIRSKNKITLKEACDKFFTFNDEKKLLKEVSFINKAILVLKEAAKTKRFGNLYLCNYINIVKVKEEKQFSAITYIIDDKNIFIAYRGTDNNIVGWKEDFNMSFMDSIPSQITAVKYLNKVAEKNTSILKKPSNIMIGGHSKGGNLAIYAACNCNNKIKNRIIKIYNNDGPGFITSDIMKSKNYLLIKDRIITFVPETSIIGMLLNHEENYIVVKSEGVGIMQHDAMSWQVIGNSFIHLHEISKTSKFFNKAISTWLANCDYKQREDFVNGLFNVLDKTKAKTINDLAYNKLSKVLEIVKTLNNLDEETKFIIIKTSKSLFKEGKSIFLSKLLSNK